jgi:signal transduction histidine kinase
MKFPLRFTAFLPRSIAFRLIGAVLAVELLAAVLVSFLSFGFERHIHFHSFDVMLHGRVDSILGAVQDADDPQENVMLVQADLHFPPDDIYEVYDANGRLLGRSNNWQGVSPNTPAPLHGNYLHMAVNGRDYRLLRFHGSRTIDVAEPGGGKLRQFTIFYGSPTARVWEAVHGSVEFYAAGSLLMLLVTGPLIAWLLHRGLLPLRQLAALAALVSVDSWQFSPPASARSTPELAPLTNAIENVLKRLEISFQQQRVFVSDAAHELKTAVAVIKSTLQLLGMKHRTPQEYQDGLDRCLADSLRLEEIVAKMLTLAREESAASASAPQPVGDLAESLRQTVAQLETAAALRGIKMEVAATDDCLVPLASDDCALLLSNLLLNALQHSAPSTAVAARLSHDAESAELQIQDQGDGIDPEALPHVFDRFYRGDPARARSTGGTGLGLAICKAIVERAGGSIAIASQPSPDLPNQGTTVTVRLPLAAETAVHEPLSTSPSA